MWVTLCSEKVIKRPIYQEFPLEVQTDDMHDCSYDVRAKLVGCKSNCGNPIIRKEDRAIERLLDKWNVLWQQIITSLKIFIANFSRT